MFKLFSPRFVSATPRTRNLLQRMARFDLHDRLELIGNEFGTLGFRTGFTLADQVLTHALITTRSQVEYVVDLDAPKNAAMLENLKTITRETYGIRFDKRLSNDVEAVVTSYDEKQYTAADKVRDLLAINPLADWSDRQLIAYALAHEVPVDPQDIASITAATSSGKGQAAA